MDNYIAFVIITLVSLFLGCLISFLILKRIWIQPEKYQLLSKENQELQFKMKNLDELNLKISELNQEKKEFQQVIFDSNLSNEKIKNQLEILHQTIDQKTIDLYEKEETINDLQNQKLSWIEEKTILQNSVKNLDQKIKEQQNHFEEIQAKAKLEFEKLAQEILEEKSNRFKEENKNSLENLINPLKVEIESFRKKVNETYDKEAKERFSLGDRIKELVEQTNLVSEQANNLVNALKGQTKTQGNWGEMILESILEKSGLVKDREYFLQETIKDEFGKQLRPDVLVKLPDERIIIIDSKVSLNAYERFSSEKNLDEQKKQLNLHVLAIKNHIQQLSQKSYDDLEKSLDFVMMFLPIEPAYLLAMQADQDLWNFAYERRILLVSPTNLIASLKLITDLWKRDQQNKNALQIVSQGAKLYDKFSGFVNDLEEIGKHLNNSQNAYQNAFNKLSSGKGNLINQVEKLRLLGLKTKKQLPEYLIDDESENEE